MSSASYSERVNMKKKIKSLFYSTNYEDTMYKFFTLKKGILNYSIEFQAVAGRDENVTNQDYIKYIPSLCEQI